MSKHLLMTSVVKYVLIFLAPYLVMIAVNELSRLTSDTNHIYNGSVTSGHSVHVINATTPIYNQCSWYCHDDTHYCLAHHSSKDAPNWLRVIYNGIISTLISTGEYALLNVVLFGVAWPILIMVLLIAILRLRYKIKKLLNE